METQAAQTGNHRHSILQEQSIDTEIPGVALGGGEDVFLFFLLFFFFFQTFTDVFLLL